MMMVMIGIFSSQKVIMMIFMNGIFSSQGDYDDCDDWYFQLSRGVPDCLQ